MRAMLIVLALLAGCHAAPNAPAPKATQSTSAMPEEAPSPASFTGIPPVVARTGQSEPDKAQFAALTQLADKSCHCASSTKDHAEQARCWAAFDASAATFKSYEEPLTMCMPSVLRACFGKRGCLIKDYGGYCSEAEFEAAVHNDGCGSE